MLSAILDELQTVDPEGIELVPAAQSSGVADALGMITLGQLCDFALARYQQQLASVGAPEHQTCPELARDRETKDRSKIAQYKSAAFTSVAKRHGGWDVCAKTAVEAALVGAQALANNRKPRSELKRALGHLAQYEHGAGIAKRLTHPAGKVKELGPFAQLLSVSMERKGISITELAGKFGIKYGRLRKWVRGENLPSAEFEAVIKRMSVHLGLDRNDLWMLNPTGKRICWPPSFPNCRKARDRVVRKCPGLAGMDPKVQERTIWAIHDEPRAKVERKKKHRLGRDMSNWPGHLTAELSVMLAVKKNRAEPSLNQ